MEGQERDRGEKDVGESTRIRQLTKDEFGDRNCFHVLKNLRKCGDRISLKERQVTI